MKRTFSGIFAFLLAAHAVLGQSHRPWTAADILLKMERLGVLGSVLYFAAHPDDENTRLIAYLANERKVRTAYLSLTRGDGGQNLIGTEQGIELGLIRTQELLQARKTDGGEQFFSSAVDFGFSKTPDETLRFWNREEILREAVWVVRKLRPDVIITRFPPDERGGHGHHQASAMLAHEAFIAAADPNRFPEQLAETGAWQAKRLLWNTANFMRMQGDPAKQIRIDIGRYNPLLGKSYGELAALSRSQHKSQGFGSAGTNGVLLESFEHTAGERATDDLFDGIDLSWNRLPNTETIQREIGKLLADFDPQRPQASVAQLARIWHGVQKIDNAYWKARKSEEIDELLLACAGIKIESLTAKPAHLLGKPLPCRTEIILRNPGVTAKVLRVDGQRADKPLPHHEVQHFEGNIVPDRITQPYWLERPQLGLGRFDVRPEDTGSPMNRHPPSAEIELEIAGVRLTVREPLQYKYTDPVRGEVRQLVEITPALTVSMDQASLLVPAGESRSVRMVFQNHRDEKSSYTVRLGATSPGWKVEPEEIVLDFAENRPYVTKSVQVANADSREGGSELRVEWNGRPLKKVREIAYDHIPKQSWFPEAAIRLRPLAVNNPVKNVAYIMGAGDRVPEALRELGTEVDVLPSESVDRAVLAKYDAVVLGVRVLNTDRHIAQKLDDLYAHAADGGTVLMQYNVNSRLQREDFAPRPMRLTRARVTEEDAKVTFADPADPVLHWPNTITEADFEGWVQERGLYFAEDFDESYRAPLLMNDRNEAPHNGSLLITRVGKGKFVYTSLAFFRQLPAGVPGAHRLFINLLAKEPVADGF